MAGERELGWTLKADSFTLQQAWDDCIEFNPRIYAPMPRFVLRGDVVIELQGETLDPHRVLLKDRVFQMDVFLMDGRTLRLLLPPEYPCRYLRRGPLEAAPIPPYEFAEKLGFCRRDPSRPVTDADRLVLDLTKKERV